MKKLRLLLITLCVSVLMGSMAVTAYAGGGEEWDGLDPVEPLLKYDPLFVWILTRGTGTLIGG